MKRLKHQEVEVALSGAGMMKGWLADLGPDVMLLHADNHHVYIPLIHVESLKAAEGRSVGGDGIERPEADALTFRKTLYQAKGLYAELGISNHRPLHGYMASVMNDFCVFHSPIHKTVVLSLRHLKYWKPYNSGEVPYGLEPEQLPLIPPSHSFARSFEQQLNKMVGKLVVLDLGERADRIGVLRRLDHYLLEVIRADGKSVFVHLDQVKAIQLA